MTEAEQLWQHWSDNSEIYEYTMMILLFNSNFLVSQYFMPVIILFRVWGVFGLKYGLCSKIVAYVIVKDITMLALLMFANYRQFHASVTLFVAQYKSKLREENL